MSRGKGNPRCAACEGKGVVHTEYGYSVCACVRRPASRQLIAKLSALPIGDFAEWDDASRLARGWPPYTPQEGMHHD